MDNYVESGDQLKLTAPSGGVVVGVPKQMGQLLVVPATTAAQGVEFTGLTRGVFTVPKAGSQAWTVGAIVYWDEGNDRFTTVAAGNLQAGVAVEAVGNGASATTGKVRLDGIGRAQEDT